MQGAQKRQVNAEEMLAELKRALESSTRAPNVPPPSASTMSKSSSLGRESPRPQADANADNSVGEPPRLQKSTRLRSRSWKLTAGGFMLAGAVAICAGFVFMNQAAPPKRELSVPAERLVMPQNELALHPSDSARAPMQESPQAGLLQAGSLAPPDAGAAPANNAPVPAPPQGKAEVGAPHLGFSGLESAAPAFTPAPLDEAATLAPAERIGPDGAPIAKALSTPASTDSTPQAETLTPAASPTVRPDGAKVATAPSTPSSTDSPPQAETPNKAATLAPAERIGPDGAPIAKAPATPASTDSAPQAQTANKAATPAASPTVRPDGAKVATAPSTAASTDSAPQAETPKPNATPTEHASNESPRPSTPKIHSRKKPSGRTSLQKLAKSAKASAKPVAQAERRSTEAAARPKEAEKSPEPAQGADNPTPVAPAATPTAPQRFADGVTHAFGYLMHLPGALVSHPADPNAGAH